MLSGGAVLFANLPDDLYTIIFSRLDSESLRAADATCRTFRASNRSLLLWRILGMEKFAGIELEDRGTFEQPLNPQRIRGGGGGSNTSTCCNSTNASNAISSAYPIGFDLSRAPSVLLAKPTPLGVPRLKGGNMERNQSKSKRESRIDVNWKIRYVHFSRDVYQFRAPFDPVHITSVLTPDEVAYTKCRLRADLLVANPEISIYLEVDVSANADNLSLAIVDFDEGGKSSVTFSPDTGAVIKETKVQEAPRRVKGSYIQPVKPNFTKFEGKMGMYVRMGLIAFFRQYSKQPWETTGFCVNFSWAKGKRLTPCLAFRDEGRYLTQITQVSKHPPFEPHWDIESFDETKWDELNWEGGPAAT